MSPPTSSFVSWCEGAATLAELATDYTTKDIPLARKPSKSKNAASEYIVATQPKCARNDTMHRITVFDTPPLIISDESPDPRVRSLGFNSYLPFVETTRLGNIKFISIHHYILFSKALLMGDIIAVAIILEETNPAAIPALGRITPLWDKNTFDKYAENLVYSACVLALQQNPELMMMLLNTTAPIAYVHPFDAVWGLHDTPPRQTVENAVLVAYPGLNLLGRAYMRARDVLRKSIV